MKTRRGPGRRRIYGPRKKAVRSLGAVATEGLRETVRQLCVALKSPTESPEHAAKVKRRLVQEAKRALARMPAKIRVDAPKVNATVRIMREVVALLQSRGKRNSDMLQEIGLIKPGSIDQIANEIRAVTWNGYAISVVVVVDRVSK